MHTTDATAPPASTSRGMARSARLADFFKYHGLWAPGVRLFRRLQFRAKALILSAMFIIPIALLSWQYFGDKGAMIEFTSGEREGVQALHRYMDLQMALVHVQAAEAAVAANLPEGATQLTQAQNRAEAALTQLTQHVRASHDPMGLAPLVEALTQAWQAHRSSQHHAVRGAQHEVLNQIGDASGLVLDPDLDSFYLMKTLVFSLPSALDDLGYLWAWGAEAAAAGPAAAERQRQWQVREAQFSAAVRDVIHAHTRAIKGNIALQTQLDAQPLKSAERRSTHKAVKACWVPPPSTRWRTSSKVAPR